MADRAPAAGDGGRCGGPASTAGVSGNHPGHAPPHDGRRFRYQTAFCLHSFAITARTTVRAEIYDDGSIDAACASALGGFGPGIRIHAHADLKAVLDRALPEARFPVLRDRWLRYPNIRKLIDVHLGGAG